MNSFDLNDNDVNNYRERAPLQIQALNHQFQENVRNRKVKVELENVNNIREYLMILDSEKCVGKKNAPCTRDNKQFTIKQQTVHDQILEKMKDNDRKREEIEGAWKKVMKEQKSKSETESREENTRTLDILGSHENITTRSDEFERRTEKKTNNGTEVRDIIADIWRSNWTVCLIIRS